MKKPRKILISAIGNTLKCDDGLGLVAVDRLNALGLPDNVETADLGTSGLSLLYYTKGYDKVIFIDAIKRGGNPGSVYVLRPPDLAYLAEDVNLRDLDFMSMHEIGLEKAVAIGVAVGEMPSDVVVIGCEPEDINTFSTELTDNVRDALPRIIELVLKELDTP